MSDGDAVRTASCSCGALTATCRGAPTRVSVCHCFACQRRTGSVYGAQARFAVGNVAVEGPQKTWTRNGDDGGEVVFVFCPTCATTLSWTISTLPGEVAVAVGAFADPTFPAPTVTVYDARAHAWARVEREGIVHHD
jgi:hypothetical protein